MNGLWTVILSALAILLTDNLYVKRIDRNVIRSDAKRGNAAWQLAIPLTQLMRFERSKFRETHRRRCYNA